jgi:hypothetical protein
MPDPRTNQNAAPESADRADEPVRYPENAVVGIIDTVEQLEDAVTSLEDGGFLASEIEVLHGQAAATKLSEATGRTGFAGLAMRVIASIGLPNDETAMKNRYAEALQKGWFLVSVLAPTKERQQLATNLLHDHGGKFVNFLGRYTIEQMRR